MKQLAFYGANSVTDSGLGRLNERDGRRGDLPFKDQGALPHLTFKILLTPQIICLTYSRLKRMLNTKITIGIDFKPLTFEMHMLWCNIRDIY